MRDIWENINVAHNVCGQNLWIWDIKIRKTITKIVNFGTRINRIYTGYSDPPPPP